MDWIIPFCGLCALLLQNAAHFLPCGRKILRLQFVSGLLWAVHYGLRGLENVMYTSLGGSIRNLVSAYLPMRAVIIFVGLYTLGMSLLLLFSIERSMDFLPVLCCCLFFIKVLNRDRLIYFHIMGVFIGLMWATYHLYCQSWFGAINDGISVVVISMALARIHIRTWRVAPVATSAC